MFNEHEDYDNYDEFGPEETPHSVLTADGDELMVRYCVARCAFAEGDRGACQKFYASEELQGELHYEQLHEHHY